YGGLFALCDEGRALLHGIDQADSVALDPHKTLFLPYGTGAALVRDGQQLLDAFSASAEYIRPFSETDVGPSPADLSPELTRHFPPALRHPLLPHPPRARRRCRRCARPRRRCTEWLR